MVVQLHYFVLSFQSPRTQRFFRALSQHRAQMQSHVQKQPSPKKHIEYPVVQKGSVQCLVGTVGFKYLFFAS